MLKQGTARGFGIEMMGTRADDGGAMGNNRNFAQTEYAGGPYPYDDDYDSISTRSLGSSMHALFDISRSVANTIGRESPGSGSGFSVGAVAPSNRKAPFPDSYASNHDEYDNISRGRSLGSSDHHPMSVASAIEERHSSGSGSGSASSGGAVAPPAKPKVTARETQSPRVDNLANRRGPVGKSGFSGGKVVPAEPMSTVREGESLGPMSNIAESEHVRNNSQWENFEHELYHRNARSFSSLDAVSNVHGPMGTLKSSGGELPSRSHPPARADPTSTERERDPLGSRSGKGEYGRTKNPKNPRDDYENDLYHGSAGPSFIQNPMSDVHGHMGRSGSSQTTTPTGTARLPSQVSSQFPQFLSHEENRSRIARDPSTNIRGPVGTSELSVGAVASANPTSTVRERDSLGFRSSVAESEYVRSSSPWENYEHELYHGNLKSFSTLDAVSNMHGPMGTLKSSGGTITPADPTSTIRGRESFGSTLSGSTLSLGESKYGRNNNNPLEENENQSYPGNARSSFSQDLESNMRGPSSTSGASQTMPAGTARIPPQVSSRFPQIDHYLSHKENRTRISRDPSTLFSHRVQYSSHEESRARIDRDPLTNMRGPMGTSGTISRRVDSSKCVCDFFCCFVI
jgi:hypothetical protein